MHTNQQYILQVLIKAERHTLYTLEWFLIERRGKEKIT